MLAMILPITGLRGCETSDLRDRFLHRWSRKRLIASVTTTYRLITATKAAPHSHHSFMG